MKATLKVKGKIYKAKTNAKGKATFNLKKLTKKANIGLLLNLQEMKTINYPLKKLK